MLNLISLSIQTEWVIIINLTTLERSILCLLKKFMKMKTGLMVVNYLDKIRNSCSGCLLP